KRVEAEDGASGNTSRRALVEQHLAALERRVSHIILQVDPSVRDLPGTIVRIDGIAIGKAAWGLPMPFDPGVDVIVVDVPGKERWEAGAELGTEADTRIINVATFRGSTAPPIDQSRGSPSGETAPVSHDTRAVGGVLAAAGLAAAGAGTYFGLRALQ